LKLIGLYVTTLSFRRRTLATDIIAW